MKVQVEVLRAALNKLLDHAKEAQGESIEVDADLYWFVPKELLSDPEAEPTGLTLGSLDHDWSEVAAIGNGAQSAGREGATIFQTNQARVILNPDSRVMTVMPFSQ
jgi:hypothetical protein